MPLDRPILIALTAVLSLSTGASGLRKPSDLPPYAEAPDLAQIRRHGNERFRAADYAEAVRIYTKGAADAQQRGDHRSAIRFLNNLGSVNLVLLRYRDAVRSYLAARALSDPSDGESWAALGFNLSSVYLQLGEVDAAKESARRGLDTADSASAKFRPKLLTQMALIALREQQCDPAEHSLLEAVDLARSQLDTATEAEAWNELGNARLECGRLPQAEVALIESYRLRKLTRDPRLPYSYESLAELRLLQQNPEAAVRLLDLAVDGAAALGPAALWRPLYSRGRAKRALGRLSDAYADLAEAVRGLRSWRAQILPADAFRVSSDVEIHRVYAEFVDAAGALYRETRRSRYAAEGFAAAEESRAASLRALWAASDRPRQLPVEYAPTLAALRAAESETMPGGSDAEARRLRATLAEMEASAGLDLATPAAGEEASVSTARGRLADDEVYLAFHTGDAQSWLWTLTRDGIQLMAVPSETELRRDIAAFVDAIRESRPETPQLGAKLYAGLFGSLPPAVLGKTRWTIAADGPLFDLPIAALSENGRYLIENHILRMVTGLAVTPASGASAGSGAFVGIADPVYNRADPRNASRAVKPSATATPLELPRLPGSGREVEACAAIWRGEGRSVELVEGPAATRIHLARLASAGPSVLHVAAHMLFPGDGGGRGMLALSLQNDRAVELVGETDIAGMSARIGLVVLNGCSSGRGVTLPGVGLMGMTRAWLAAGASSVIATRWPAPDQNAAALFPELYRLYLHARSVPARWSDLLRDAQLAELRAGGSRAAPAAWASYFSVERN